MPASRALIALLAAAPLLACPAAVQAQTEPETEPDLSDDRRAPTRVVLTAGNNTFSNTVVASSTPGGDIDYFTVDTGPNLQIDSVQLTRYVGPALSFIGFGAGETLPFTPPLSEEEGADFIASALGFSLVDANDIGNLLFTLAQGDVTLDRNAQDRDPLIPVDQPRFDPINGLGSGVFAFVFQETGVETVTYELDIQTSVIPEPSSALLAAGTAALLGLRRRPRTNA